MTEQKNQIYLSERLIKRMDECFTGGITVVRAPEGFGKSVCTDEYFRRCVSAVSKVYWLTCDGLTPSELSEKFCAYVKEIDETAARGLEAMDYLTPGNAGEVGAIVKNIKSELPVWFVVDRIEAMPEEFRSCCADLVKPDDENVHIVVLTREKTAFDAPAITAADLTLSRDELAEMAENAGIKLHQHELGEIMRTTSGWLTAVSLTLECYKTCGSLPETADIDTLIGTLYDALSGERRMALRRLCFFSRLTPAKVQFLIEKREISDNIREFFRTFPLIRYSTREDCWYLHELLSRYIISNSCDVVALARSAAWYCQTGAPGKAISCYYSRLDYEGVLSVDFSRLDPDEDICGKPFIQIVRELARCPAELKLKYPLNMLRAAHFLFGEGDYAAYDALMNEMEAIIRETGDEKNYGEWMLESIYQVYPDLKAMRERVDMAASRIDGRSRMIDPYAPFAFGSPSMWYCFHSTPGAADEEANEMEKFIASYSELTGGHGQGADKLFRGELMCARGELDKAELLSHQAESIAKVNGQFSVAVGAMYLRGETAVDRMDISGAEEALKRIEELPREYPYTGCSSAGRERETAYSLIAAMLRKQIPASGSMTATGMGPASMMARLAETSRLIDASKYSEVAGMLEAFLTMDTRSCTTSLRHYVYTGLSVCYMRLGNIQKALNCIQTALDISAPDKNLMTFARSGTILDKILSLAEPAYTDAVAQIGEIRSRYMPETAEHIKPAASISLEEKFRNLPEPLTDREIEIAKLAAEGMRNKEIAAMLFLSERTVSNRLYTIFQKLNIDRRSELIDFIKEAE